MPPESIYWTQSTLIHERQWTLAMIAKLLGEPDKLVPNPHYSRKGEPMRLYLHDRVQRIERGAEWRAWQKRLASGRAMKEQARTAADHARWDRENAEIMEARRK